MNKQNDSDLMTNCFAIYILWLQTGANFMAQIKAFTFLNKYSNIRAIYKNNEGAIKIGSLMLLERLVL